MTGDASTELITTAFRVLGTSMVQVLIFIFLYESAVEFYVGYVGPMNKVFGFGMQVNDGIYLLSILAIGSSIAQEFCDFAFAGMTAWIVSAGVWISYWANIADEVPNRFLLISVLGMLSLATGLLLMHRSVGNEQQLK